MPMSMQFDDEKISRILDQSLVYQCACPAQVCKTIIGLRELYEFQEHCLDQSDTDKQVHQSIANSVAVGHEEMEACLEKILELEGWDRESLTMPDNIKKTQRDLL